METKFLLGTLVVTRLVSEFMNEHKQFADFVTASLNRYILCDWGGMSEEDCAMNNDAIKTGDECILGSYQNVEHSNWKIWIITEWDRSVTTVLFPSEY